MLLLSQRLKFLVGAKLILFCSSRADNNGQMETRAYSLALICRQQCFEAAWFHLSRGQQEWWDRGPQKWKKRERGGAVIVPGKPELKCSASGRDVDSKCNVCIGGNSSIRQWLVSQVLKGYLLQSICSSAGTIVICAGRALWRGSCSIHLCLAARLKPSLNFVKAELVWVQFYFLFGLGFLLLFGFWFWFFCKFLSFQDIKSSHFVLFLFFWRREQTGSVGCISLSGLELVVVLLVHSCIFPGSITISTGGPHRSRLTLQIFFTNHLIQLGCQDLALKPARYISLSWIRYDFIIFCLMLSFKSKLFQWWI